MSKPNWRILNWLLLLLAGFLIYAALSPNSAEQTQENAGKSIQLIIRTSKGDYWQNVAKGAGAAVKEYGVDLYVSAPKDEGDIEGQVKLAMSALDAKPDAIVLGANADADFEPFLEEAAKRNIPVIAIDSILTSGKTRSYIGIDNYSAGKEALRELAHQLGGVGNVAIVAYTKGSINGKLREQGIRDAISEYKDLHLADRYICSDEYGDCQETVRILLDKGKIDGILSLNIETTIGAALEIKEREAGEKVKLVGFDSSSELLEMLQENQLQALIVQNPFSMGYLGIKHAIEVAKGDEIQSLVELRTERITKENMFWLKNQKLLFPIVQ